MNEASAYRIPLVILGTSLFAPEVADLIDDTGRYDVTAFIENWDRDKTSEPFLGRPVVGIDDAGSLASTHQAVCSLGDAPESVHRTGGLAGIPVCSCRAPERPHISEE